jgi:hypothetical protein
VRTAKAGHDRQNAKAPSAILNETVLYRRFPILSVWIVARVKFDVVDGSFEGREAWGFVTLLRTVRRNGALG